MTRVGRCLLEVGRRLGIRRRPRESEGERGSLGTIEGAMFALFGRIVLLHCSGVAFHRSDLVFLQTLEQASARLMAPLHKSKTPQTKIPSLRRPPNSPPPVCGSILRIDPLRRSREWQLRAKVQTRTS